MSEFFVDIYENNTANLASLETVTATASATAMAVDVTGATADE